MIKAVLERQLMIHVDNDVGMLASVTSIITSTGINLLANCAYAVDDKAAFMFVTDDNNSARKLLEVHNIGVQEEEVIEAIKDLVGVGVDVLTLGQYLQPTPKHLPVQDFVTPEQFDKYKEIGLELGIQYVESGPLVRSSYHAEKHLK